MINLIVFGPPYSGKGTQSEQIAERYNLVHISTGEMLRIEAEKGTALGLLAKSYTDNGGFAPTDLVINMMDLLIKENINNGCNGFVFDGFPRSLDQAKSFESIAADNNLEISLCIGFDVDENELIDRASKRALTSNRTDDQDPAVVKRRIQVYHEATKPVADYYRNKGIYQSVNGMTDVVNVFGSVCKVIEKLVII